MTLLQQCRNNLRHCCNVDMSRDDNIDVTLAVLEYSDKIHLAALCTFANL